MKENGELQLLCDEMRKLLKKLRVKLIEQAEVLNRVISILPKDKRC